MSNISSKLDEHLHQQQHAEQQQAQQQWQQYQVLQQQQAVQQQQQHLMQLEPAVAAANPTVADLPAADATSGAGSVVLPTEQQQEKAAEQASGSAASAEQQLPPLLGPPNSAQLPASRATSATGSSAGAAPAPAPGSAPATAAEPPASCLAGPAAAAAAAAAGVQGQTVPGQRALFEAAPTAGPFPGVAAAAAVAAVTGELDRQLLDESWGREADGGVGGAARSGSGAAAAAAARGVAGGVTGAKGSAGRRGVVVMLLAEGLEVVGEKGSKVPNIRAAQLGLEVEACLSASLTYSPLLGWQSAGLSFEVLSLERQVQGSNLPLPKTLIKSLLNAVMPSVFTKLLLTSLPHELGKFILDSSAAAAAAAASSSSSGQPGPAGVWLAGEVSLAGPPLPAWLQTSPAPRASVTGLSRSSSAVAAALGSGPGVTLNDLCRFYLAYSDSAAWERICGVWQAAVDALCLQLAREEGSAAAAAAAAGDQQQTCSPDGADAAESNSSSAAASFDLGRLMRGRVAGLVRKPVRLSCGLRQLLLSLDVGAGLAAARDYCERAAQEFAENAKGEDALLLLQRPLSMQLELLHLWHAALSAQLAAFAQQFRGAGGRLLLAAHRAGFSAAAEACSYEGPLRLEVPLPLLADLAAGACVWDVALPDPRAAAPTLAAKARFVAAALAKAAFGTCEDEQEALREAAAAEALAAAQAAGDGGHTIEVPATQGSSLPCSSSSTAAPLPAAGGASAAAGTAAAAAAASGSGGETSSGSIGRVSLSRLSVGLVLDERRLQELLAGGIKAGVRACACVRAHTGGRGGAGARARACVRARGAGAGGGGRARAARAGGAGQGRGARRRARGPWRGGACACVRACVVIQVADANLVGGLLGCFGQLFTANLAPGWQQPGGCSDSLSRSSSSSASAAAPATGAAGASGTASADAGSSDGAAGAQKSDQQQEPCGMLTVRNNDITRVRAELESASFVSAVAPRIAVRLLHIVALAVVLKFFSGGTGSSSSSSGSKRLEYVNKVFGHVAEYLGRDCLDLLLCVDVAAAASEAGGLQVSLQGVPPAAAAAGGDSSSSTGAAGGGTAAAGGSCGAAGGGGSPSWPVYVINDVNLLTVLDTEDVSTLEHNNTIIITIIIIIIIHATITPSAAPGK
ncbi:hypothetical protein COO60DRAFT_1702917 [Scenedesmus sp. NREL 46B-D3]|nr:hypothetical protein COO60DRAFT_1702917 [Scenedesmus sp. NREL 46B-D3]